MAERNAKNVYIFLGSSLCVPRMNAVESRTGEKKIVQVFRFQFIRIDSEPFRPKTLMVNSKAAKAN